MTLRSKLKPYQVEGVDYLLSHRYAILADSPGIGKSAQALTAAIESTGNTLIVCPAYLRQNWVSEIRKWVPQANIDLFQTKKQIFYPYDSEFAVIGYDQLMKAEPLFQWADNVIVDETHYFFNAEAKRTEKLHELADIYRPKNLYLLSGTPIKNRVAEFYSLLVLMGLCPYGTNGLNVGKLFPYFEDFAERFSKVRTKTVLVKKYDREFRKKIPQYYGIQNPEELKKLLKGKYLRRLAEKVLDLATPIFKPIHLGGKEDPKVMEEFMLAMESENPNSLNSANKRLSAVYKVPKTIEYVKGLLEEGIDRVVVYSDHVQPVEEIAKAFEVPPITGAIATNKRMEIAAKWQSGETKVLVATIESFSTGINLIEGHHMVLNDESWDPASNEQAIGRIKRIGQMRVPIIHQMFIGPQDEKISKLLKEKEYVTSVATNL